MADGTDWIGLVTTTISCARATFHFLEGCLNLVLLSSPLELFLFWKSSHYLLLLSTSASPKSPSPHLPYFRLSASANLRHPACAPVHSENRLSSERCGSAAAGGNCSDWPSQSQRCENWILPVRSGSHPKQKTDMPVETTGGTWMCTFVPCVFNLRVHQRPRPVYAPCYKQVHW